MSDHDTDSYHVGKARGKADTQASLLGVIRMSPSKHCYLPHDATHLCSQQIKQEHYHLSVLSFVKMSSQGFILQLLPRITSWFSVVGSTSMDYRLRRLWQAPLQGLKGIGGHATLKGELIELCMYDDINMYILPWPFSHYLSSQVFHSAWSCHASVQSNAISLLRPCH